MVTCGGAGDHSDRQGSFAGHPGVVRRDHCLDREQVGRSRHPRPTSTSSTETTSRAIVEVGSAQHGKAIIVLNPAEPPLMMRDTVYCLADLNANEDAIASSIKQMVADVAAYVPGYRLKQEVQFERIAGDNWINVPGVGRTQGIKVSVFLEVEGAAHYLPSYAGNLDIMTSAALATAERMAARRLATANVD